MSNSPAMSRPQGADDFDHRARAAAPQPAADGASLAELAQLVGEKDPFKGVFPQAGPKPERRRTEPVFAASADVAPVEHHGLPADYAQTGFEAYEEPAQEDYSHVHEDVFAALEQEFSAIHGPSGASERQDVGARTPVVRRQKDYAFDPATREAVEPSPDVWAQGDAADLDGVVPDVVAAQARSKVAAAGAGRTLIVLAAVVVLTGGGLAASFLARPSGASAVSAGNGPPVIMAATGPSKVQPPASANNGPDGASEPSTLLDKNHDDGTATAKVVNNVEQPIDLSQAVKSSAPKPAPQATAAATAMPSAPPPVSSPFPEPRKVKTVVVLPNGAILADGASAPSVTTSPISDANLAFDPHTAIPMPGSQSPQANAAPDPVAAAPAPTPAKPASRPTARRTPPPTGVDASVTDSIDAAPTPAPTPKPPRAKPQPVQEAAADPDDNAPAASGGGYAVQLGAPPSQSEAREVSSRLQKKFADALGGHKPSIQEGKSGERTVYRIRVSNLAQDDAKALCSKLKSSGGACFVVRN